MALNKQNQTGSSRNHPSAENSGSEPAAAFTPGPWSAQPSEPDANGEPMTWYVVRGEGRYCPAIANIWPGSENPEADARLMAAARELLAACRAGLHALMIAADHRSEIENLEAAIAKALGQSEDPS